MFPIPETFAGRMAEVYGDEGVTWLRRLPALLDQCARRWSLTLMPPYQLSYNYVCPAVRADGTAAVLKVGMVNLELLTEIAALRLYDGGGCVRLLDADTDRGVMLLEQLRPGTPLLDLNDDRQATAIAAQVMRQLWRPLPSDHPFPTVEKWSRGLQRLRTRFNGSTGPLSPQLVQLAESLFAELLPSMAEPVLLHGDLHHWNILAAERQSWLALDPKGVVGEPVYEVGAWLRNPMPEIGMMPDAGKILARRVDQFAEELGFDRSRILGWGVAQAVLSAWWSIEDHGYGWEAAMTCADLLARLM